MPVNQKDFREALRDLRLEENRASRRAMLCLDVALRGRGGAFQGRTIDISRHGLLVEIGRFAGARQGFAASIAEIDARFGTGIQIAFVAAAISVAGTLVRAAPAVHGRPGAWLLAFRFDDRLTTTQCRELGVPTKTR